MAARHLLLCRPTLDKSNNWDFDNAHQEKGDRLATLGSLSFFVIPPLSLSRNPALASDPSLFPLKPSRIRKGSSCQNVDQSLMSKPRTFVGENLAMDLNVKLLRSPAGR